MTKNCGMFKGLFPTSFIYKYSLSNLQDLIFFIYTFKIYIDMTYNDKYVYPHESNRHTNKKKIASNKFLIDSCER